MTRYCEIMNIDPTLRNKATLLAKKPLTACEVTPSWNSSGWLADFIQIYPNKPKKQTFENQREAYLLNKHDMVLREKQSEDL